MIASVNHIGKSAVAIVLLIFSCAGAAEAQWNSVYLTGEDYYIRKSIQAILRNGDLPSAIRMLEERIDIKSLASGDLLLSDLLRIAAAVEGLTPPIIEGDRPRAILGRTEILRSPENLDEISEELRLRLSALDHRYNDLPANILGVSTKFKHVLLVDGAAHRLYAFNVESENLIPIGDFFVRFGQGGLFKDRSGDMRTPVGIYVINRTLDGRRLGPAFGPFAWTLDYPNAEDRRAARTGSSIWIHGVPTTAKRAMPLATEGCIALSNSDLELLGKAISPGRSLVVLLSKILWVTAPQWAASRREQLQAQLPVYGDARSSSIGSGGTRHVRRDATLVSFDGSKYYSYNSPFNIPREK